MITTLPGLYIWTSFVLKPFEWWSNSNLCSLLWFRFINVIFSAGNLVMLYLFNTKAKPSEVSFCSYWYH